MALLALLGLVLPGLLVLVGLQACLSLVLVAQVVRVGLLEFQLQGRQVHLDLVVLRELAPQVHLDHLGLLVFL